MTFNDGETIKDFVLHLNGMETTIAMLGVGVEEAKIVEKAIRSVPL